MRATVVWWIILVAVALVALVMLLTAPAAQGSRVETAITYLVRNTPAHPVAKRPEWRAELAGLLEESANANQIPVLLWVAIVYRESSFRPNSKGLLGEVGLTQIHGTAARGCDLSKPAGQLECGARWLARCRDRCGDLERGFALYASGRTCRPARRSRLKQVVSNRFRLWRRLEAL